MEAQAFKNTAIWAPVPKGKRAQRIKWAMKPKTNLLAYGVNRTLVIRDLANPGNTMLYSKFLNNLSCVRYSPNGYTIAVGDDKGAVQLLQYSYTNEEWHIIYENDNVLGAPVQDIAFTEDSKKIVMVGQGAKRAVSLNIDTQAQIGEMTSADGAMLSVDLSVKRPFKCIMGGEDMQVHIYKGPPFKPEFSNAQIATGFVNKVAFTPWDDNKHYISVSADKSLKVYDSKTYEVVIDQAGLHKMGINDFVFTHNDWEIVTGSSDRTIKKWKIDIEAKTLTETSTLQISEFDTNGYKNNVDKQILGLIADKESKTLMAINMQSDINIWKEGETEPSQTLRGHMNTINGCVNFNNQILVTGDNDGRILFWDPNTGLSSRPDSNFVHKLAVSDFATNSKFIYSGCQGCQLQQFTYEDGHMKSVHEAFITKGYSIRYIQASEEHVWILYNDLSIEVLDANDINTVIAKREPTEIGSNKATIVQITVLPSRNELWVADNKGFAHILNATTLEPVEAPEIKTEYGYPGNCIGSSSDGNLVAIGDIKGTVTLFDAETRTSKFYVKAHMNKSTVIKFTSDNQKMYSLGQDKSLVQFTIENKAKKSFITAGQGEETRDFEFFDHNGIAKIYVVGTSCAISEWTI